MTERFDIDRRAVRRILDAAERGVHAATEQLLDASRPEVPVASGRPGAGLLRDSGRADADGLTGAVSYDTEYAEKVHERMDFRHPTGRAKFLEGPLNENREALVETIADHIRRAIGR